MQWRYLKMTNSKFIILDDNYGINPLYVRKDSINAFYLNSTKKNETLLFLNGSDDPFHVIETPEEILKLINE